MDVEETSEEEVQEQDDGEEEGAGGSDGEARGVKVRRRGGGGSKFGEEMGVQEQDEVGGRLEQQRGWGGQGGLGKAGRRWTASAQVGRWASGSLGRLCLTI